MTPTCRFCFITLHPKEDGTGWKENDEPNCPENPSGPQYGHSTDVNETMKRGSNG